MDPKTYYNQPGIAEKAFGADGQEMSLNSMSPGSFSNSLYSQLFIQALERITPAFQAVSCGAGIGRLEAALLSKSYIKKLTVIDISGPLLNQLKTKLNPSKTEFILGDITQLSQFFKPTRSWFICNEVISDLPVTNNQNTGALEFLHQLRKVMIFGSLAVITEYGYPKSPMPLKLGNHTEYSIDTRALEIRAQELFGKENVQLLTLPQFFGLDQPTVLSEFLKQHPEKYMKMNDQQMLSKIFPELRKPTLVSEQELEELGVTATVLNSKRVRLYTYDQIIRQYYPFFALVIKFHKTD